MLKNIFKKIVIYTLVLVFALSASISVYAESDYSGAPESSEGYDTLAPSEEYSSLLEDKEVSEEFFYATEPVEDDYSTVYSSSAVDNVYAEPDWFYNSDLIEDSSEYVLIEYDIESGDEFNNESETIYSVSSTFILFAESSVRRNGASHFQSSWNAILADIVAPNGMNMGQNRGEFEVRSLLANRVRARQTGNNYWPKRTGVTTGGATSWTSSFNSHIHPANVNSPWRNLVNNDATFISRVYHS